MQADPGHGKLSRAIRQCIEAVHNRFKDIEDEGLIEETHQFPEWANSWEKRGEKRAVEFSWSDAMRAQGISAEEIAEAADAQALKQTLDRLAAR